MAKYNHCPTHIYWDRVLLEFHRGASIRIWRAYMQKIYKRLITDWLPEINSGLNLKTDLFEEAISSHHLLSELGSESIGIDCSLEMVIAARERLRSEGNSCLFVIGDLRRLPLKLGIIKSILSGSSLDHFQDKKDIEVSLAELARVLMPGGTLVITFDNRHNPIVWLRNRLPFNWLSRLRLVPYYVGATYNRSEAYQNLQSLGFTITDMTTVAHAPRILAIWFVMLSEYLGWAPLQALIARILDAFEILKRWPTRYLTGYYIAIRAEKIDGYKALGFRHKS